MKKTILLLALLLAGCANPQNDAEKTLAKYRGRPVDSVVAAWGAPVYQHTEAGEIVFTFSGTAESATTSTSTTIGSVGNTPVTATTTSSSPITISCRIQVFTGSDRRIVAFRHNGAAGACSNMYQRL